MFRALTCPSSGGKIVFTQHLVSSLSVNVCTVHWLRALNQCTVQKFTESEDTLKRICASSWTITMNHCMMHGQQNVKHLTACSFDSAFLDLSKHFLVTVYEFPLQKIKWKSSPFIGLEWPRGFQEVKVPRFHDNGTGWW